MKVGLVILHYQGKDLTAECLNSLTKLKKTGFEPLVVVVNNHPGQDLSFLEKKFKQFKFINPKKNLGFAAGNNVGIKLALENQVDWVVLLNNDTVVAPDFLAQLIRAAKNKRDGGLFAPKIYFAPGSEFHRERYESKDRGKVIWYAGGQIDWQNIATPHRGVDEVDHGQYDQLKKTEFISGCAMLIKKEVFAKVGLLDAKYFLYYEDADFCQQAKKAGFELYYVPQSKVWHQVAASSEIGGKLHDYFMVRNQLLFGFRYAPGRTKLALLKQSLRFLLLGRKWQKRGVIDFYLGRFGRGSWR